jgi:hypothetical protein
MATSCRTGNITNVPPSNIAIIKAQSKNRVSQKKSAGERLYPASDLVIQAAQKRRAEKERLAQEKKMQKQGQRIQQQEKERKKELKNAEQEQQRKARQAALRKKWASEANKENVAKKTEKGLGSIKTEPEAVQESQSSISGMLPQQVTKIVSDPMKFDSSNENNKDPIVRAFARAALFGAPLQSVGLVCKQQKVFANSSLKL